MNEFSPNYHETSISKSAAPLHIKFALFCLTKTTFPKWLGYFCYFLSHLQAFGMILKSAYIALPDNTPSSSPVMKVFIKLFVIGDWLDHTNTAQLLVGTLLVTLFTMKIIGLMIYVLIFLYRKQKIPDLIQDYWSMLHSVHPLVLFFWIHTFCMEIINYSKHHEVEIYLTVTAYVNTIINCLLSLIFSVIAVKHKTKNALSAKTNILETKNVFFKILIPILWVFGADNEGIQILTLVLCLFSALLHDLIFIRHLPYYRIKMLFFSAILQAAQTSLALVAFIVRLVETKTATEGIFSVQIVWLLAFPLMAKAYYLWTWRIIVYILQCDAHEEKNLDYLVHKRFILMSFVKSRKVIHPGMDNYTMVDLLYQAKLYRAVLESGVSHDELEKDKKLLRKTLKSICLRIVSVHPKAFLVHINLAYLYAKFEDLYLVSNQLIEDLITRDPGYHAQISLRMIRSELQKKLSAQFSQRHEEGLNIYNYTLTQDCHQQVKNSIEEQAKMQFGFWKEFLLSKPSMLSLLNIALKVKSQKNIIKKQWNNLFRVRPAAFLSPLIVYGMYSSLLNNDPIEGEKYIERSHDDTKRLRKFLKVNELNNDTVFSDKTIKITMSGLKSKLGKVLDCTGNILFSYGWQNDEIEGKPITKLMPPFYRQRHDRFLNNHYNTGKTKILNQTSVYPVRASNGYIVPTWIHVKVSPLIENGITYFALLKPCRSNQRMLLVRKDGVIDAMSFEFAQDMNLLGDEELNIMTFCPEFRSINDAFNTIAKGIEVPPSDWEKNDNGIDAPETQRNTDIFQTLRNTTERSLLRRERRIIGSTPLSERTKKDISWLDIRTEKRNLKMENPQEIYDNFVSGSTLIFDPKSSSPVNYHVRVSNNIHGKDVIKFVMLEKVSNVDSEDECKTRRSSDDKHDSSSHSLEGVPQHLSPKTKKKKFYLKEELLVSPKTKHLTSPRRLRSEASMDENLMKSTEAINLLTLDEVQSNDFIAREAVFRKIINDKDSPMQVFTFGPTDEIKVPFPTQQESRESGKVPLVLYQTESNGVKIRQRKTSARQRALILEPFHESLLNHGGSIIREDPFSKVPLKKLKKKVEDAVVNARNSEDNAAFSDISKGKKAQHIVAQALKTDAKKKSETAYLYSFALFVISMVVLVVLQTVIISNGIQTVQGQVPVITTALFRQNSMIYSSLGMRIWNGALDGYYVINSWEYTNAHWKEGLTPYTEELRKYNSDLYTLIDKISDEARRKLYEKNVGFYDYAEDGSKTLISMSSTFEAFQVIIEKEFSCLNIDLPPAYSPDIDRSDFEFLLNNMLNDLLIQSQNQINELTYELDDSTNSTNIKMGWMLGTVCVICLIFLMISIRYLYMMASESNHFMTVIFRMKPQDCEDIQVVIQRFRSALNTNMKDLDLGLEEKAKKRDNQQQQNTMRFRSASMDSLYKKQRVLFSQLIPNLALFICWSLLYFFLTRSFIENINFYETQMEAALQALNNQSLFVVELTDVTLGNKTAMVRNKNFVDDYLENLDNIQDISVLADKYRDKNGDLTSLQEQVLFYYPCEELITYNGGQSPELYGYCLTIGKGSTTVGLANINSQLSSLGAQIFTDYDALPKTKTRLGLNFLEGYSKCRALINVAQAYLMILYDSTYENFDKEVATVKDNTIIWSLLIFAACISGTMITWHVVVKKIFWIQKIDRHILQVIPIKLIVTNKHLQQYLLFNYSNEIFGGSGGFKDL